MDGWKKSFSRRYLCDSSHHHLISNGVLKETAQTGGSCSRGGRSPSAIFFPEFHDISTGSHPDDQSLIGSRDASTESATGGEDPLLCDRLVSVLQSQKYPWCATGPLELP